VSNQITSNCFECDYLEAINDNLYHGESPTVGSQLYKCKKRYFTSQQNPSQPKECKERIKPHNNWNDIQLHNVSKEELYNQLENTNKIKQLLKNL
jgi:hypothetical protein